MEQVQDKMWQREQDDMDEDSARMDREVGYVRGVGFIHRQ
jgi:hypothetical protein